MPTKKQVTEIAQQQVEEKELAAVLTPKVESTSLVLNEEKELAELRSESNMPNQQLSAIPMLKLEHTTSFDGEPNPLKGHFTLARKNDLGEWDKEDLGTNIKVHFLLQRHYLQMVKNDDKYSSPEFDSDLDIIGLWKRTGDKSELVGEGTSYDLQKMYLKKDDKNRVMSELRKLYKLYGLLKGELVTWKMNLTSTIAWSKYTRKISLAAAVITEIGAIEMKNGAVKYYVPDFKALEKVTNYLDVKNDIRTLRDLLPKRAQKDPEPATIIDEELGF